MDNESIFGFLKKSMLDEALSYAARGWAVFPCYETGAKAKAPRTAHGLNDATTDPAIIRQWWERWPDAAIGLNCGASGLVAIDIDVKNGHNGLASWDALNIPTDGALLSQTPSGGRHIVYKQNGVKLGNTAGKLGDGLDTRGHGGYIVAPPSRLADGGSYTALNSWTSEPATIPDKLAALLDKNPTAHTPTLPTTVTQDDPWAMAALESECDKVAAATNGTRNDALNSAAFALGQLVGAGYLSEFDVVESLRYAAANLASDDGSYSVDATIKSGLDAGKLQPRYKPERPAAIARAKTEVAIATNDVPAVGYTPPTADLAQVCPWLSAYVDFSRLWSPRAYPGYHIGIGLWLMSTIAARRVVLHEGGPQYTSLYIALVGKTSIWKKSTTADIAIELLQATGLQWLLTYDEASPQRLIFDMSGHIPREYKDLPRDEQEQMRRQLALAGQRGWFYEEFSQKLTAIVKETGGMSEYRGMFRRFYDNKPEYSYATLGRGVDKIERPYLALLACLTPADMANAANRGNALWHDGFLSRFALICPPKTAQPSFQRFPLGDRIPPHNLVRGLHDWHTRLGVPDVQIIETESEDGEGTGRLTLVRGEPRETIVTMTPEARNLHYAYADALDQAIMDGEHPTDLDGNLARFATQALRIATLFASLSNSNILDVPQIAAAQQITERWRGELLNLYAQVNEGEENDALERLIQRVRDLEKSDGKPPTANDIRRYFRLSSDEVIDLCTRAVVAGVMRPIKDGRTMRFSANLG